MSALLDRADDVIEQRIFCCAAYVCFWREAWMV
jgi:hypothetical protein